MRSPCVAQEYKNILKTETGPGKPQPAIFRPESPNLLKWIADNGWVSALQSDQVALAKATETKLLIIAQKNSQNKEVLEAATPPKIENLKSGYFSAVLHPGRMRFDETLHSLQPIVRRSFQCIQCK